MSKRLLFITTLVVSCLYLASCSSPSEEDLLTEPLELEAFIPEAKLTEVWSVNLGDGQHKSAGLIQPVIFGDVLYVADSSGSVSSINKSTGKTFWKRKLKTQIVSGVAYGNDQVYVGAADGILIALNANDGAELWRKSLGGEIIAPVAHNRGMVIAQTFNGLLIGLKADSGEEVWRTQSTVPVLSVHGTSTPITIENIIFTGLANGKLIAFDGATGIERWGVRLASASGDSDLERITDIDAPVLVIGGRVVSGSYNGSLAMMDAASGQTYWRADAAVSGVISEGFGNVYFASVNGEVLAYDQQKGLLKWVNESLLRRGLSNTTTWVNYVVTSDYKGYMHLLSQVDGRIIARKRIGKTQAVAPMIVNDNLLYVLNNKGKLTAFSVKSL